MGERKLSYQGFVSLLFAACCFLHIATETPRIWPDLRFSYVLFKIAFGLVGGLFVLFFYFFEGGDTSFSLLMICLNLYTLVFMWFGPLYEVSYLQCAVGSGFLNLKKTWLFSVFFGLGFIGILLNYSIQDRLNWQLPPINRSDWVYICIVFFVLSWMIQKYSIGRFRDEQDRMNRFSIIGLETTRLLHDLKGFLASPLMLIEHLRQNRFSEIDFELQSALIQKDLEYVRSSLVSLNQMVVTKREVEDIEIGMPLERAIQLLEKRLLCFEIKKPHSGKIRSNSFVLQSMFFNLLLNSIEAQLKNKISEPKIEMELNDNQFTYKDNCGGFLVGQEKILNLNSVNTGLGLKIVETDLKNTGAKIKIKSSNNETSIEVRFLKSRS